MFNINGKQAIAIVGAIVSVLMVSTAQLTDLLGAGTAKTIVTVAGLLNMLLQSVTVALSTQTAQVNSVAAMPGVTRIAVNEQASPALAQVATDPAQQKVGPSTPDLKPALVTIAKAS
jgi:hypothetical protein